MLTGVSSPSTNPLLWSPATLRAASSAGSLGDAAISLATSGIPVFPCVPGAKQPLTTRGFHDATTDVAKLRVWWRRTPEANIGVPTGAASGVIVVDVDVHAGGNGFPAFDRARTAGLIGAWAWIVRTPSGGLHAYFRAAADAQRCWHVPSQHVDFRGDGGYVVVPPSRITTADGELRSYEVIAVAQHRAQPLDAGALRAFLEPSRPSRPRSDLPVLESRPDKLAAWVASRPEGARNQGLFWAACRLPEDGHSVQSAFGVLGDAALSAGLSELEVAATIRSAHRTASRLSTGPGPSPPLAESPIGL